jgi:putative Mg2+ transporter-C (MgtC) family protein
MVLDPTNFAHTLFGLAVAFLLGTLIGAERQWRQRSAGLRTNVLVTLGAAAFSDLGVDLAGHDGATRIVAYVVSGIGFLGAGVIMKDGASVRGLNTAATLWCSAAVGAFAGCGFPGEAAAMAVFVLGCNTLLRPLVNYIDRRPMDDRQTESEYRVHAICDPEAVPEVRDLLSDLLEAASYPVREITALTEGDDEVELAALLVPTTAKPAELDAVVDVLKRAAAVKSATWTAAATV